MSALMSSLLDEATTLAPKPTYQRLESLGDSVLGLFAAIMIMAGNAELSLTFDEGGGRLEEVVKNDKLFSAALRIGANNLLLTSQHPRKWKDASSSCVQIADSLMSDVVESLLGAAFIHDCKCIDVMGSVAAALFEKLQLPVSTSSHVLSARDLVPSCLTVGSNLTH